MLGADYLAASLAENGRDFTTLCEAATALVQSALRGAGLATPTDTDGAASEPIVQLAALGQFVEILATAPGSTVPLPQDWATNPLKMALQGIIDGEVQTVADPSALGAVGGFGFSISTTNGRKTSTEEMDLY